MSRLDWTPGELDGVTLEWLVDLTLAGQIIRVSTAALTVSSSRGDLAYGAGILTRPMWRREMSLFSRAPEQERIVLNLNVPLDMPGLSAEGHRLAFAPISVSQVRVSKDGTVVDAWEDRLVCLTGRCTSARYGIRGYGAGPTHFSDVFVTAERPFWDSPAKIPLDHEQVASDTWDAAGLSPEDLDVAYPVILGRPGYDPLCREGWVPAGIVAWLQKDALHHVAGVALGSIEATTCMFVTDADPEGQQVNLGTEYDYDAGTMVTSRDARGTLVTCVDYRSNDYDGSDDDPGELPPSYWPAIADTTRVYFGFHDGGGMPKPGGGIYRGAGDILVYLLTRSGVRVDFGAATACVDELNAYLIDTIIDEQVSPLDFLITELLPLLPVTLVMTERGIAPLLWRHTARPEDAALHLDLDADASIEVADTTSEEEYGDVKNHFTLRYGYDRRTSKYTRRARLGSRRIESTEHAECTFYSTLPTTGRKSRIHVRAIQPGPDGAGIVIRTTIGSLSYSEDVDTKTILLEYKDTSTGDDIAAMFAIPTLESELVTVSLANGGDGTATWGDPAPDTLPDVTTVLGDFGTRFSPLCESSQALLALHDGGGPSAGIRRDDTSSMHIYDAGTAARILDWKAAAYALPPLRVELSGPVTSLAGAALGQPMLLTSRRHAFTARLGTVEAIDTDGITTGIRIVFHEAERVGV